MLADILIAIAVSAPVGGAAGWAVIKYKLSKNEIVWNLKKNSEHAHRFDTMLGDGKGWRCGECGKLRKPEKS